ncbi:recombination-associated protein RdgC [Conchiformibius steedae]|uniref:recombination-associated protein RdgC n=1 Tax=Conchiformibius steedae TaxID=153493 RepID=UPI0026ED970C|nr:recombination-associated protein RdgC [Conchiformibius steedae]
MAYFKQVTPFFLKEKPNLDNLETQLNNRAFVPLSGLNWFSNGFTAPMQSSDTLAFSTGQAVSVCLKCEERLLPRPVITRELEKRVKQIAEQEGRKVGKKEQKELRERIIDELLPHALIKESHVYGLFIGQWLFVGIANEKRAENFIKALQEALGGLQVFKVSTNHAPVDKMTEWLRAEEPSHPEFEFGAECTMVSGNGKEKDRAKAKVSKHDLTVQEVLNHAEAGKMVKEIELSWSEKIAFIWTDTWTYKRLVFADVQSQNKNTPAEEDLAATEFAMQTLVASGLEKLTQTLVGELAGLSV